MSDPGRPWDWEWEGRRYTMTWIGDVDATPARVYAIAVTARLEMLLVEGPWEDAGLRLPGGGIESGEGVSQALARELDEEAGATLIESERLGMQHVASPGRADEFHAFRWCRIELGDFEPGPEAVARHLVRPSDFLERLHWGRDDPKAPVLLRAALDAENRRRRWLVVPARPEWAEDFEVERGRLEEVFRGCRARIEHIGSTAVPGLAAKPIIDILIGVRELADVEARIDRLSGIGYRYVPDYEDELPERRYFRKPFERPATHHLHIVVEGTDFWHEHLAFRDALRADRATAQAYAALKERLSIEAAADGADYTELKTPFIRDVLRRVRGGE